jgi:crossover junction endodeoxyribonuclease RuvC
VVQLIDELKPDICVLEKAFFGANAASALKLGEVRGALIAACGSRSVTVVELAPTKVKKIVAGNGRATKEDVCRSLETLLEFNRGSMPLDATDALALAFATGLELPMRNLSQKSECHISKSF